MKRHFLKKEFAMFIVIGAINTFNATVLSFVYSLFLQANLAFAFGYISALVIGYFLNSYFVFRCKPELFKLMRFAFSYVPNFTIQNILVFILYNSLHWHRLVVYAIAAIIGMPLTFIILKVFTFKSSKN